MSFNIIDGYECGYSVEELRHLAGTLGIPDDQIDEVLIQSQLLAMNGVKTTQAGLSLLTGILHAYLMPYGAARAVAHQLHSAVKRGVFNFSDLSEHAVPFHRLIILSGQVKVPLEEVLDTLVEKTCEGVKVKVALGWMRETLKLKVDEGEWAIGYPPPWA